MFCSSCGKENPDTAKFCRGCRAVLKTVNVEASQVSNKQSVDKVANRGRSDPRIGSLGQPGKGHAGFTIGSRLRVVLASVAAAIFLGLAGYGGYTWYADKEEQLRRVEREREEIVKKKEQEIQQLKDQQAAQQRQAAAQREAELIAKAQLEERASKEAEERAKAGSYDLPDVKVGDRWTYNNLDNIGRVKSTVIREVMRVNEREIVISVQNQTGGGERSETVYTREWNQIGRVSPDGKARGFTPPYPYYSFPLSPGKTWTANVQTIDEATGRQTTFRLRGTVHSVETVRVPAGQFDALKLTLEGTYEGSVSTGTKRETYWYVPKIKRAVKSESLVIDNKDGKPLRSSVELVTYSLR